jgi:hypothetical protein
LALGGCTYIESTFLGGKKSFSGDPFPIEVDTTSGAIVLGMREAGGDERTAVLDLLSPITLVDVPPDAQPIVSYPDVDLFGESVPGGAFDLQRAHLGETNAPQVIALHPCSDDPQCTIGGSTCAVGSPSAPREFDALIGIDAFSFDALRLHLADNELFVLPDIAGDDEHRTQTCDAVLSQPFRGGGTLVLGGSEVPFSNWRIALQTCLAPDPREYDNSGIGTQTGSLVPQSARGADVLLVLSTGIGVSLLGESAYARYAQVVTTAPPLDQLPTDIVCLPSGPVSGHRATIATLALVGNPTATTPRAPCRQVYAHHKMTVANCFPSDPDCPCLSTDPNNGTFCSVPAIVELAPPGGLDVLVVSDADDTLQALRTELRPDQAEVDGILGADALRTLELDVDYQHDRALVRCTDLASCGVRPQLLQAADRGFIVGDCIAADPGPIR